MDVRLLFPNEYLSAADLQSAKGGEVTLTISGVKMDKLRTEKGEERKPVVTFREMEAKAAKDPDYKAKKLVLNKTNAKLIAAVLGVNETDEWVGRRIILYATTCAAFGKTVDCIRVRERDPGPAKKAAPDRDPGSEG